MPPRARGTCRNALTGIFCFGTRVQRDVRWRHHSGAGRNALTGIFCFGTLISLPSFAGRKLRPGRNALTGIFCFGTWIGDELYVRSKNKSQCPYGHFLFWNVTSPLTEGENIIPRRNALTGIFCFGTKQKSHSLLVLGIVAMPLRAFFVLEHL